MARKLDPAERSVFAEALKAADASPETFDILQFVRNLEERSSSSLKLSQELGIWFGEDVSGPQ